VIFWIVATLIKILFIVLGVVLGLGGLLTWGERKQSSMLQDRIGPNRASILGLRLYGIIHFVADGIKMLFKEDFDPPGADRFVLNLAPALALFPVLTTIAVVPFGPDLQILGQRVALQVADVSIGVLFIFALGGMGIYGMFLGGWASNNKWGLLGGLRAASQMLSYEVVLGLSLVPALMYYGSLRLSDVVALQGGYWLGFIPRWGIIPLFPSFIFFLIAAVAETKRAPFDLPEGESEIIGYFVEYSGLKFGMFFLAEFMEIVVLATVLTTFFFGGWHFPLDGAIASQWLRAIFGFASFMIKVVALCYIQLLIRWTLPRFRYDQLMRLCWKNLLPIGLAMVFVYALALLAV
jgi:NADH-quinone oxidoreductase subunit H